MSEEYPVETVTFPADQCLWIDGKSYPPLKCIVSKPKKDGIEWDQTEDAGRNMRYAQTLLLTKLPIIPPHDGRAVIVGGAPSIKARLEEIRELSKDPNNAIFAVNWTHNWLLQNGIVPKAMVFFEIDAEPDDILESVHSDVVYFVCSHCHQKTFDQLLARVPRHNVVLWHNIPDCGPTKKAYEELFWMDPQIGGGICTFLRSVATAMALGYRDFECFGVDQSYPDDSVSTHIEGYPTIVTPERDGVDVWVKDDATGDVKKFKSAGYLIFQVEEFKQFCKLNHHLFTMRVNGDGMLPWVHKHMWPCQYK